jgi:hypothetical protein
MTASAQGVSLGGQKWPFPRGQAQRARDSQHLRGPTPMARRPQGSRARVAAGAAGNGSECCLEHRLPTLPPSSAHLPAARRCKAADVVAILVADFFDADGRCGGVEGRPRRTLGGGAVVQGLCLHDALRDVDSVQLSAVRAGVAASAGERLARSRRVTRATATARGQHGYGSKYQQGLHVPFPLLSAVPRRARQRSKCAARPRPSDTPAGAPLGTTTAEKAMEQIHTLARLYRRRFG